MPSNRTTFILGAGASCDYGFPLGLELRRHIIASPRPALDTPHFSSERQRSLSRLAAEEMATAFHQTPELTIDAFLSARPNFQLAGKSAIAGILLPCERDGIYYSLNRHTRSDRRGLRASQPIPFSEGWYGWLNRRMLPHLIKGLNPGIEVITFNYDRSFEYSVLISLAAVTGRSWSADEVFPGLIPVHHVYGDLGVPIDSMIGEGDSRANINDNHVSQAVENLLVVGDQRVSQRDCLSTIRTVIKESQRVVFMGFAYDKSNIEILGITNEPRRWGYGRTIYGTALGLTEQERASAYALLGIESPYTHPLSMMNCVDLLRNVQSPEWFVPGRA